MVMRWWIAVSEVGEGEVVVVTVEVNEDEEAIGKKKDLCHNSFDTM